MDDPAIIQVLTADPKFGQYPTEDPPPHDADPAPSCTPREKGPSPPHSAVEASHHDDNRPIPDSTEIIPGPAVPGGQRPKWITGVRLFTLCSLLTVAVFLMMLDTSIVATALPRITDEFNSLEDVGWYVSLYPMGQAAVQPLTGRIYLKFNNRAVFLTFLTIFEVGSTICGAASSSKMLIVGRVIAGVRAAGIISGGLVIIACAVPLWKRTTLVGIMMAVAQTGLALGPVLGGAFTSYSTWRWCFYINLPLGCLALLGLLFIRVPDQCVKPPPLTVLRRLHRELDLGGNKYRWDSLLVVALFVGAFATFSFWFAWNYWRGPNALIPTHIVKKRIVWSSAITQCLLLIVVYCASFYLPIYFQAIMGLSPMMSGVYVLPSILTQLFMTGLGSWLVKWWRYIVPNLVISGVLGAVSNGLMSTFTPSTTLDKFIGYQILNGIGRGISVQMAFMAVQAALTPEDVSIGMSVVVFVQSLGTAIALATADALFQGSLRTYLVRHVSENEANDIIALGVTNFRLFVKPDDLPYVLQAYSDSIDNVFCYAARFGGLAVFIALFLGRIKVKREEQSPEAVRRSDETGEAGGDGGIELRDLGASRRRPSYPTRAE